MVAGRRLVHPNEDHVWLRSDHLHYPLQIIIMPTMVMVSMAAIRRK
jgi:hypothetical protein